MVVCVLEDALLPAERKLVELGEHQRVRETRAAFQAATAEMFVSAIEEILGRRVRAFSSGADVEREVVFEMFLLERDDGQPAA